MVGHENANDWTRIDAIRSSCVDLTSAKVDLPDLVLGGYGRMKILTIRLEWTLVEVALSIPPKPKQICKGKLKGVHENVDVSTPMRSIRSYFVYWTLP